MSRFMRILLVLSLAASLVSPAMANQHPINDRGFKPEQTYDFNGFDTVSMANGNLLASIPLGITYPVAPGLSYSITLR
ncbi:MAG: hypothetical protein ACLGH0_07135, partial [Thermoanaerobaculia bacterium]